ncbi:MAG TPA: hypothetical protein VIO64_17350 [Pseudobacteroides sp.]|uniref:hypothetical protein n=1 Tax=Pseudobacteroides sp. TaxID=1968840 RepID=UPI002F91E3CF
MLQNELLKEKSLIVEEQKKQLQEELDDQKLLQSISVEFLCEGNTQALYERIIDTAMRIMHSDYASMQMFYTKCGESGKLRLLAYRDFNPEAARLSGNGSTPLFLAEIICDKTDKPADYLYLDANPALEKVIGLKNEQIVGETMQETLYIPNSWIDSFAKVALTRESTAFEGFSDGLDRHFAISTFSPKQGQVACLIQDITEHKHH